MGKRVLRIVLHMGNMLLTAFKVNGLVGYQVTKCEVSSYLARDDCINAGYIFMKV